MLPNVMSQDRIYCDRIGHLRIQFNRTEFVVLECVSVIEFRVTE